jgi:CheY-like chemotaxis protein
MRNILLIDDNAHFRFSLCKILRENKFHVIEAENGYTGLQLAQEQYPDLILCDLDRPQINGYEVLKKLREHSITAKIPVILLTSSTDDYYRLKALELGANLWILKPVDIHNLLQAIAIQIDTPITNSLLLKISSF